MDFGGTEMSVEGFISSATFSDLKGSVYLILMGKVFSISNHPPEAIDLYFI